MMWKRIGKILCALRLHAWHKAWFGGALRLCRRCSMAEYL